MKLFISSLILIGSMSSAFAESNSAPKYSDEYCKQLNDDCLAATKAELKQSHLSAAREDEIPSKTLLDAQAYSDYACGKIFEAEQNEKCD